MSGIGSPPVSALTGVHPAAFDRAAEGYDARFTGTPLGRWLRDLVAERLDTAFRPGDRILELGCGTGEDAVRLAGRGVRVTATDASEEMLAVARRKAQSAGMPDRIEFRRFDFAADSGLGEAPAMSGGGARQEDSFDGAFSNFGAVNCVADRSALAESLAALLRPGAPLILVVMGPFCLWEIGWHLARGRVRDAFRRFRSGRPAHLGGGATTRVWYPSPTRLRSELAGWFDHRGTVGVGVLLPPSYLAELVGRHAAAFERIRSLDRRISRRLPASWLGDHYLSLFERR